MDEQGRYYRRLEQIIAFHSLASHKEIELYFANLEHFKADELSSPITVLTHRSDEKQVLTIRTPSRELTFESSYYRADGVELSYNHQVLGSVQGRYILIHFDPYDLFCSAFDENLFVRILDELIAQGLRLILNLELAQKNSELESWLKSKEALYQLKLEKFEQRIEDCQDEISELRTKLRLKYHHLSELRDLLAYYKSFTPRHWEHKTRAEYESIQRLIPQTYKGIDFKQKGIEAITSPIDIIYEGYEYHLGRYRVWIDLENEEINFSNLERTVDGYHHPHIDTDGTACWGNIEEDVARLLAEGDAYGLLVICSEFLRSYSPENPFLKIEYWDPNYDPEEEERERYQLCYEQVSAWDCVTCTDSDCPYFDDAFERCHEVSDTYTCITCEMTDCPYYKEEILNCQSERREAPWECINCPCSACEFAGRESACFELHQGEYCQKCSITNCSYHPSHRAVVR